MRRATGLHNKRPTGCIDVQRIFLRQINVPTKSKASSIRVL